MVRLASAICFLFGIVFFVLGSNAHAKTSADVVIKKMESLLWSDTNQGIFEMTIVTPHWKRTLVLNVWMDRPNRTFIRVMSPKKERGIGSLRIDSDMWNYIPKIDRSMKIPPSMMLQPWMGSDFSNDDLVKESSLITDYTHEMFEDVNERHSGLINNDLIKIVSTPKPDAAVVWGKVELWVHAKTGMPEKQLYYDESGEAIKEMTYSSIKEMDGRSIPTRWEMRSLKKEGKRTVIELSEIKFDREIDSEIFTERHLRSLDW